MILRLVPVVAVVLAVSQAALAQSQQTSALWGKAGEKWSPASRLPDFSFAGYRCGEKPIPTFPAGVSVKQFGAKGDGIADDSQAFLDALAKVKEGAIEVPPGRYKITKILEITKPNLVLRGAGPDKSILFCPIPLEQIKSNMGATTGGRPTSNYSWSGGFVWFKGNPGARPITPITADAKRGDSILAVGSTDKLKVGQRIQVFQSDKDDNSLAELLYSTDAGDTAKLRNSTKMTLVCRIVKIAGNQIQVDRPLRCDLKQQWSPQIRSFEPTVHDSGLENIGFEFPNTVYKGHFTELGLNAATLQGVSDCWIRNIRIVNADSGPYLGGFFCTVEKVVIESARTPDKSGSTGHHGISFYGQDNLATEFDFRTQFIHDISFDGGASGNVASSGRGVDMCFDHHKRTPYENCLTNIDIGAGTHPWRHGGGDALGKACAARGTFWNIRSRKPIPYPPASFGPPSMNFVALESGGKAVTEADGKWFEPIAPDAITPANLHQAQLKRRLGK